MQCLQDKPDKPGNDGTRNRERVEKALKTTKERSLFLFQSGYRFEPDPHRPGFYFCRRPLPFIDKKTGEIVEGYWLDVTRGDTFCSCPQFNYAKDCKHRIALVRALRDAVDLLYPMLKKEYQV